ncbi:hypothetical protein BH11PAT1_BH11PAT1_5920 [soil metagenome]
MKTRLGIFATSRQDIFLLVITGIIISISLLFNIFTLFSQSIRLDESQSILFSIKPTLSVLSTVAKDVHVPLYNLLLHFWMQLFGTNIIYARILSLLFFLATLPVLYLLAKEASNKYVALVTVTLFALSPFITWFSHETRMYTLFIFTTCLQHLFFLKLLRKRSVGIIGGLFISTLLGAYSHYFFSFLIITQVIYLGILYLKSIPSADGKSALKRIFSNENPYREVLITYFAATFIAYLFLLPWIGYVLFSGGAASTKPLIPSPTSYNLLQTFILFIFGNQSQKIQSLLVALWPLSVLILFFVFTHKKNISTQRLDYFMLVTFVPVILMFVISYIYPIFLPRYLIFITPTLFFLLAWLLVNYSKRTAIILTLLLVSLMFSFSVYQSVSADTPVKENYKGVANYLSTQSTSEDIILVSPPFTTYPIEYSYQGTTRIATVPEWNRYDEKSTLPPFSLPNFEKQMKKYEKQYSRAFIVLSYDQGYQASIQKYLDTHYQLESKKEFSYELQVRVYKLRYN